MKKGHSLPLTRLHTIEGGHPLPDASSMQAAKNIIELLQQAVPNGLVLCLLSGGASALITDVPFGCSLNDLETTMAALLSCNATIAEINTVRKHLSRIKGGQLVKLANGASVVSLIISDVIGNDLSVIGSGLTVADDTTFENAIDIIDKYALRKKIPECIIEYLENGRKGDIQETPKTDDPIFSRTRNYIIGDNRIALEAAKQEATGMGYAAFIVNDSVHGEAETAAHQWINSISAFDKKKKICLIGGGETTVNIRGSGKGGRNQQFALAAAIELDGYSGISLLAAGTDGTDGPTDCAGAIVNSETAQQANTLGIRALDYLKNNDAYHFFKKVSGHLKTGPTQTNVMDMIITLIN